MPIKEFATRLLSGAQPEIKPEPRTRLLSRAWPEIRPELIPIKLFAHMLGVSIWTARGWAYEGKISSCKISRSLLIPATEIDRLISENLRPRIEGRK